MWCNLKIIQNFIQIYTQNTTFEGYANVKLIIWAALPDEIYS